MGEINDVVIASSRPDADAAEALRARHARMGQHVEQLVRRLAEATSGDEARGARDELAAWAREELLTHLDTAERTVLVAARSLPGLRVLVEALCAEQATLRSLADALAGADRPAPAVAAAAALEAVLDVHLQHLDTFVLPALAASSSTSVADLVAQVPALADAAPTTGCCGGSCGCGR